MATQPIEAWRSKLQAASFRGVPFYVDSVDVTFGRRNVLNEYPQLDTPFSEDLGKKAREYSFTAFLLGPNYLSQRDALINAIENNSTPGTLIHPSLGSIIACPKPCRITFSREENGIERCSLEFTQAGVNPTSSAKSDTTGVVQAACNNAIVPMEDSFNTQFNLNGTPQYIPQAATANVLLLMSQLQTISGDFSTNQVPFAQTVNSLALTVPAVLYTPLNFAESITSLMASVGGTFYSPQDGYNALQSLTTFGNSFSTIEQTTSNRVIEALNQTALIGLVQQSALVEMARITTSLTFDSYDAAVAQRDQLTTLFDQLIIAIGNTNQDDLLSAMRDVRAAIVEHLTTVAASLVPLVQVTLPVPLPALVVAYNLYDDSTRDSDIIARNNIMHPGFLPALTPLTVLNS